MGEYAEDGTLSYPSSPSKEWKSSDQLKDYVFIDNIVDPKPELPSLNKMVRAEEKDLNQEDPEANKYHLLKDFHDPFEYLIDITLPQKMDNITKLDFLDKLPGELEVLKTPSLSFGSKKGEVFTPDATSAEELTPLNIRLSTNIQEKVDEITLAYAEQIGITDPTTLKALAGKVIRISVLVKIRDAHLNKSTLHLNSDDQLVNTAILTTNDLYKQDSQAFVTPPEVYALYFKKLMILKSKALPKDNSH